MKDLLLLASLSAIAAATTAPTPVFARAENGTTNGNGTSVTRRMLPHRDYHPCVWSMVYTSPQCCSSNGGTIALQDCQSRKCNSTQHLVISSDNAQPARDLPSTLDEFQATCALVGAEANCCSKLKVSTGHLDFDEPHHASIG